MTRRTKSIPDVRGVKDPVARDALDAVKDVIEGVTGRTISKVEPLAIPSTATAIEISIIRKLNEVIDRLQF